MVKSQVNAGRRRELYYFRDAQGLEVDFVTPTAGAGVGLVEAKAGRTVTPAMAAGMQRLATAFRRREPRREVAMTVVHRPARAFVNSRVIAPGGDALPWPEFARELRP